MEIKDFEKLDTEAMKLEYERLRKELKVKDEMLGSFNFGALASYEINVTKGILENEIVMQTENGPYRVMESVGLKPPCRLEELIKPLSETTVGPENRYWFTQVFSRDLMMGLYEKGRSNEFEYRRLEEAPGPRYMRHHMLFYKDPETGDVMAKGNAKDVTNRYRMQGAVTKRDEDVTHAAILHTLSEIYYLSYYVDIADKAYIALTTHDEIRGVVVGFPDIQEAIYEVCRLFLLEEYQAEAREFFHLESLKKKLKGLNYLSAEFESKNLGWVRAFLIPADHQKDGDVASVVIAVQDINREKRIEQEKQEEQERQKALEEELKLEKVANEAKTSFLFNMSHDIRTPMNAIMGFTNIASKNLDDRAKVADSLGKIKQSGNLLLSLINSILEVSRIESGHAVLDERPSRVERSFANIEPVLMETARAKDIDLTFETGRISDSYILCDFDRFNRIMTNIITNAIKYTKEGGRVRVRAEQVGESENGCGTYRYTVEDNGIGMSEEFQKHLFDRFSREKNSTTSGIQGTGLGMTVVQSFVGLLNGTVECRSKQGVGTTIIVTLPFRLQTEEQRAGYIDPDTGLPESGCAELPEPEAPKLNGLKILLVEDNELNRMIAQDILEDEGIIVEAAEDGAVSVQMLKEKGPEYYDAVLMDIQMPVMNGYEATKAIREMYPDKRIPVIALSANAFAEDKAASVAAGMDDHVAKPINVKELFSVLAKYI